MDAPDTEIPSCIGLTVLGGGLRPWSQTVVLEGPRPWGRGRTEFAKVWFGQFLWKMVFSVLFFCSSDKRDGSGFQFQFSCSAILLELTFLTLQSLLSGKKHTHKKKKLETP